MVRQRCLVDDAGVCWEGYRTDLVCWDHRASEVGSQHAQGGSCALWMTLGYVGRGIAPI